MLRLHIDEDVFKKRILFNNEYRNYKRIDSKCFFYEFDQELLTGEKWKYHNDKFSAFTNVFRYVLDKYAPLNTKTIRGNHAPFVTENI